MDSWWTAQGGSARIMRPFKACVMMMIHISDAQQRTTKGHTIGWQDPAGPSIALVEVGKGSRSASVGRDKHSDKRRFAASGLAPSGGHQGPLAGEIRDVLCTVSAAIAAFEDCISIKVHFVSEHIFRSRRYIQIPSPTQPPANMNGFIASFCVQPLKPDHPGRL